MSAAATRTHKPAAEPTSLTLKQELTFRVAERIFAGPYVETLLSDKDARRRVILRSKEFVDLFLQEVA